MAGFAAAALAALLVSMPRPEPRTQSAQTFHIEARLAEAGWSAFSQKMSSHSAASWAVRIPTWAGLALLLGLLTYETRVFAAGVRPPLAYAPQEVT